MTRPELDQYMLDLARVVATRSTCSRLSVGAVLSRGGRVLSTGYNGAPSGQQHCRHFDDEPCRVAVHAEVNAIVQAARHGVATEGADLFLTHSPCLGCSGLLLNAGVVRVVFALDYRNADGADRLAAGGVTVEKRAA